MMKRTATISIGVAALFGGVSTVAAQQTTLYDQIKNTVQEEMTADVVEPEIATYVSAFFTNNTDQEVSSENVTQAVKNDRASLCGNRAYSDDASGFLGCDDLMGSIKAMVKREQRVRAMGRAMQLSAAGQEIPVADVPGRALSLASDLRGIVNIWSAGTDTVKTGSAALIRTKNVDPDTYESLVQSVGTELRELSDEEQIAAVWRYQYGVRLVRDDRKTQYPAPYIDTQSGPGTERQYLFKRWTALESAMIKVWDSARRETFDPPLEPGESAILLFPSDFFDGLLPENMLVWARVDGGPSYPLGDVGLQWKVPLEPVLPSLVDDNDEPILGGLYPPEPIDDKKKPVDGRGLCSDPLAQSGYLCRRFAPAEGEQCPDDANNPRDPNAITLTLCEDKKPPRTTISGPDVCRDIVYTDMKPAFDPQKQCTVALRCSQSCGTGYLAITKGKDANGVISICVNNGAIPGGATYMLYHELHHAYQECGLPPAQDIENHYAGMQTNEEKNRACCGWEGEAYRAQCDMMEQDGVFTDDDGNPVVVNGITLNAESCAEIFTNNACISDTGIGCFMSQKYPANFAQGVLQKLNNNPKDVPVSCDDAIDPEKQDPRITDLITTLEQRKDVCAPGQVMQYKNRIGNNLCYIGQCVEESSELHRMTGTQSPATVGDPSNAWDDPQTGTALGNAVTNPPLTSVPLPLYRPQLVLAQFEQALCLSQGKPPLTPSVLCSFDLSQRLENPITSPIENAQTFITGEKAVNNTIGSTLGLTRALGARMGTDLYSNYLLTASKSLADTLSMAVKLFHDMDSIRFPTEMCPLDGTLPPAVSSSSSGS